MAKFLEITQIFICNRAWVGKWQPKSPHSPFVGCVIVGSVEIFIYVEATLPLETRKLHKYLGWDYFVGYFVPSHAIE
jgi:hypothetical protein